MFTTTTKPKAMLRNSIVTLVLVFGITQSALAGPQFVVALHGYDPVAYFTNSTPVLGDLRFTHYWNGANWTFTSEENRAKFATNPTAYAPQYDGYCSYAASLNYIAPANPQAWQIVDGKLYLNFRSRAQELWAENIPGNIAKANKNWPRLHAF